MTQNLYVGIGSAEGENERKRELGRGRRKARKRRGRRHHIHTNERKQERRARGVRPQLTPFLLLYYYVGGEGGNQPTASKEVCFFASGQKGTEKGGMRRREGRKEGNPFPLPLVFLLLPCSPILKCP